MVGDLPKALLLFVNLKPLQLQSEYLWEVLPTAFLPHTRCIRSQENNGSHVECGIPFSSNQDVYNQDGLQVNNDTIENVRV